MRWPTVSVIVPCYDTAAYLGDALASISAQRPEAGEIIVVDDGSTDGSARIAEEFGGLVRCVRQPHAGIGAARNRGVEEARGDVIAFLDADDLWPDGSVAARLSVLARDPDVDIAHGLVEQFVSPELPDELRRGLVCPPGTSGARVAGAMLVRRSAFVRVGVFDPGFRIGETIDWVARADAAGIVARRVDSVVLRRRIHGANTTARAGDDRVDYLRVLKASLDRRRAAARPTD